MRALCNTRIPVRQGWAELGNHLEANEELEQITLVYRAHPDVLKVRYEIYSMAKKWEACVEIADSLVTMLPKDEFGWVYRSYALHELKRTEAAYDNLVPVGKISGVQLHRPEYTWSW